MLDDRWDEDDKGIEDGYMYFLNTNYLTIIEDHKTDKRKRFESIVDTGDEEQ